jgi:hypothetical protein
VAEAGRVDERAQSGALGLEVGRRVVELASEFVDGLARPEVCVTIPQRREARLRHEAGVVPVALALQRGAVGGVLCAIAAQVHK